MLSRLGDYGYILATIAFTVYGQLILKWRLTQIGPLPGEFTAKLNKLLLLFLDPFILSGYLAAFCAALCWTLALSRFDLNYAYPFMSLSYVVVLVLAGWLLSEPLNAGRILGVALIVMGTIVVSRS
jgi:drug/metabolite transporter (DMT)-like permease